MKYLVPAGELSEEHLAELARKESIQDIISAFDGTDYSSALAQYDGKSLASVENALDKLYYFRMERAWVALCPWVEACCSSMFAGRSISEI